MSLVFRWIINALALLGVAYLVPGVQVDGLWAALIAALVLGLINAVIRPILLLLTLPINVVTLGLFTFVVNAFMIWLASSVVKGFTVTGFVPALLAALILWVVSVATNGLIRAAERS